MYKEEGAGQEKEVRRIKGDSKRASQWVKIDVGGKGLDLYCDTGGNITSIKEVHGQGCGGQELPEGMGR